MFELFLLWLLFGLAAAVVGHSRGASSCSWAILGFLLGPFGFILAFTAGRDCPKCGKRVNEKASVCPYCGFSVRKAQDDSNREAERAVKQCPFCAEQILREAKKCRYCGEFLVEPELAQIVAPVDPPAPGEDPSIASGQQMDVKPSPWNTWMVGFFGVSAIVVLVIAIPTRESKEAGVSPSPRIPPIGNPAHDGLLALGGLEQAVVLGRVVGKGCRGETAFFMGLDSQRRAYWSIQCEDGRSYQVQIHPDTTGSTNTLDCATLRSIANVPCFVRFDHQ